MQPPGYWDESWIRARREHRAGWPRATDPAAGGPGHAANQDRNATQQEGATSAVHDQPERMAMSPGPKQRTRPSTTAAMGHAR